MTTVKDMLSRKPETISIPSAFPVVDALKLMAENNIGSVVVTDTKGNYLGIVTERDYSRKVILKGKSSTDTPVSEIMSTDFPKVTPQDTIEQCMQLMSAKNIRYLPVYDADDLHGIISINDVVKETILIQQETISQLKDYLHASL